MLLVPDSSATPHGSVAQRPVVPALTQLRALAWKVFGMNSLERIHDSLEVAPDDDTAFDAIARALGLNADVSPTDMDKIPKAGPVVVVANHPFGGAEGIILGSLLHGVRPDVRVLVNRLLAGIPELRGEVIFVDPFDPAAPENVGAMREAIRHLRRGGMLLTFPAGTVPHVQPRKLGVADPEWSESIARLVRLSGAAALPVYVPGRNGLLFQSVGLVHPRLRTALLPRQLLGMRNRTIEVRIGRAVTSDVLASSPSDGEMMRSLRFRTYVLRHRSPHGGGVRAPRFPSRPRAPLAQPPDLAAVEVEIMGLPPGRRLAGQSELVVMLARADEIPSTLLEIGRLRELTFRRAGEGTGQARDLDSFDEHYEHLFIWNTEKREIAGAYRLCSASRLTDPSTLYTSTLFRFTRRFLGELRGGAVELGRSFVAPDYQRSFTPLLLLWKAIGAWVARHPGCTTLFGPMSVSADYSRASRALIARYLLAKRRDERIARSVRPRHPFRAPLDTESAEDTIANVEELSDLVSSIERDGKGVPVLLRQYLKLGGRIAALNVDRDFSDVVDALLIVDLRGTPRRMLLKYLGASGAAAFCPAIRME